MAYQNTEWSGRGVEEYYQKFIELQERLRKSEEERLQLEMKFNTMIQVTQEEEQLYYKRLKTQYKRFMEEHRKRQERNEQILHMLERIENRAAMFEAKSKRIKMLRSQYNSFLQRVENERRLKGFDLKQGGSVEKGATLNEIIDPVSKPVRMQANATFSHDLGTADQLLSRFKQPSNEATIADDIMRSIYARTARRNDAGPKVNGRRVTIEDDTDESSTEVTTHQKVAFTSNGHIPSINKCSSSEGLDNVEDIKDMKQNVNEEKCDSNKNVDQNQNSLETFVPDIKETPAEVSIPNNTNSKYVDTEIKDVTVPHVNNDDKTASETKELLENKREILNEDEEPKDGVSELQDKNKIEIEAHQLENKEEVIPNHTHQEENDISNLTKSKQDPEENYETNKEDISHLNNENQLEINDNQTDILENVEPTDYQQYPNEVNQEISLQEDNQNIYDTPNNEKYQELNAEETKENNEEMNQSYPETSDQIYQQVADDSNVNNENISVEYEASGQPIQYDANGQQMYYDENSQQMQYDTNAQDYNYNTQQYDENGQPITYDANYENYQYDENGQIVDYAQQGQQENVYYDENGQAVEYNQEEVTNENEQALVGDETSAKENVYYGESGQEGQGQAEGEAVTEGAVDLGEAQQAQIETSDISKMAEAQVEAETVVQSSNANVLELLDTESESTLNPQDVKPANESDFDFSSTSEAK